MEKTGSKTVAGRFEFVDALRGIAALYVVVVHVAIVPNPNLAFPNVFGNLVPMATTGVALFFVVSAFTLSLSTRQRSSEQYPVLCFYVRRIFRIVPLFLVLLVFYLFRDHFFWHGGHSVREIVLNLSFLFNFIPGKQDGIVWASWTLSVEMIFYSWFPYLFRFFNSVGKLVVLVVVSFVLALSYYHLALMMVPPGPIQASYSSHGVLRHMPVFVLGMIAFYLFEHYVWRRTVQKKWSVLLLGAAGVMFALSYFLDIDPTGFWQWYWFSLMYVCLLLGLAVHPARLLVNRASTFCGKISYSLYLNHPFIISMLFPVYPRIYATGMPLFLKFFSALFLTYACLIPISYLTYRFVEEPGMEMGRKLIKNIVSRRVMVLSRTPAW